MAESVYAIEALTYLNSGQVDKHDSDLMLETAITKLFSSEFSYQVIDDALQVLGGEGYMRSTGIERTLRDARINRIVEGATEVMTSFVALMGMKGVGEEFEEILKAAKHPIHNFGRLAKFVQHEVNDVLIGPSVHGLHTQLSDAGETLAHLTRRLAREVTMALAKHQLGILDRQLVQERIAWSAIELYVMAAVIARLQATLDGTLTVEGHIEAEEIDRDLTIGLGYCGHAAQRVEHRLDELHHNGDATTLNVADCVLDLPKPDAITDHGVN